MNTIKLQQLGVISLPAKNSTYDASLLLCLIKDWMAVLVERLFDF